MKRVLRLPAVMVVLALSVAPCFAQKDQTQARTKQFLDAYMRGDTDTVLRSVDRNVVAYGSDAAEIFRGKSGIASMMHQDAQLWRGSASFGEMTDVSVVEQGAVASIFFNALFRVADRPPVPVRFGIVWKRVDGHWLVVQSQNAAVTQGQSAAVLLGGSK